MDYLFENQYQYQYKIPNHNHNNNQYYNNKNDNSNLNFNLNFNIISHDFNYSLEKINDLYNHLFSKEEKEINNQYEIEYANSKGGYSLLKLYHSDIERLIPPNYLNDNLIFFYLKY
jgi:hypothetical protein